MPAWRVPERQRDDDRQAAAAEIEVMEGHRGDRECPAAATRQESVEIPIQGDHDRQPDGTRSPAERGGERRGQEARLVIPVAATLIFWLRPTLQVGLGDPRPLDQEHPGDPAPEDIGPEHVPQRPALQVGRQDVGGQDDSMPARVIRYPSSMSSMAGRR